MAAKPHPPLGDVSCRATGYAIQQLQRMKLPTAHVTRGLAYTLDHLQDQAASISWDDYLVFFRNSHCDLPTEKLVELCTSYQGSPYLRPFLSAAGLWFHPARYFERLADPESGAIRQLYRCVRTQITQLSDLELVFEGVVEPGFVMPPDLFWEAHSIGLGALTTYFGLAPSIVTWEPIERGAAFRIRLPRRRPVRFFLSWLASWFRRDTADDVRSALLFGHERSLRLEREISERKVAETALRESEERFRRITEAVPGVVYQYYLDADGSDGFAFVSHGATDLTGYTPEELIAEPDRIWERINPDDILGVQQTIQESARNGTPWQHTFRFQTKTGDTRWVKGRSIPEPADASGRIMWNGILNDVTAEKQADVQLHARDALLQKLSEQVPGVIYQYQQWPDGRSCFPYASEGIRDIYEVTPEEVRNSAEAVFGRLHADDTNAVAESIRRSLESLEPWRCEYRVQLPKRGLRWLDGHAAPERLPDGSTIWHGYIRDVTERKIAEETLRLKDTAIATSLNAIAITDAEARIIYVNRSFLQFWGYERDDEILGRTPLEFWERPEQAEAVIQILHASGGWVGELRGLRRDGTVFDAQVSANLIQDRHGRPVNLMASFIDITERKQAEQSLRESEEQLRLSLRAAGQGLYDLDLTTGDAKVSPEYATMIGHDPTTFEESNAKWAERLHPDDREKVYSTFDAYVRGEVPGYDVEFRQRTSTGGWLWTLSIGSIVARDADGKPLRMLGTHTNISTRKLAEAALRDSEERLRLALSAGRMGTFDWDLTTDRVVWSDTHYELLGYPPGDRFPVEFRHFADRLHPDDRPDVERAIREAIEARRPYSNERRIMLPDGTVRWMLGSGEARYDSNGRPVRMLGTTIDITERKRAEAALRASEERLQAIIDNEPECVKLLDRDGKLLEMNPAGLRIIEADNLEQVRGARVCSLLAPAEQSAFDQLVAATFRGESGSLVFEMQGLKGTRRTLETHSVPMWDADHREVRALLGVTRDITERKRSEQALRDSELRYRTLIETSSDAIFLMDLTGRIRSANPAAVRMHGYTLEELLAMRMQDLDLPDAAADLPDRMRRLQAGESLTFEVVHRRKDGTTFPLEVIASAVEISGEWLVIGFDRDITERKRTEVAIRESEARLRVALSAATAVAFVWDAANDSVIRYFSTEPALPTNLHAPESVATVRARVYPDDLEQFDAGISACLADGSDYRNLYRVVRPDGTTRWLEEWGTLERDQAGLPLRLTGISIDVTERKAAERALIEEKSLLQAMFGSLPGIAFAFDQSGRYVRWNHNYDTLLGWSEEDMTRLTALETIAVRDRERIAAVIRDVFVLGESTAEFHALRKDGRELPLFCTGVRVSLGGEPCVLGFGIDISDRLEAEAALRASEERLRIFIESAPVGVAMFDRDMKYISYSRRWLTDYGLGDQNLIGRSHYEVFPEVTDQWKEIHRRCLTGVSERCEQDRFERANGTVDYLRWEIQPWTNATGAVGGLVFLTEMITDRVRAEEQIRASLREKEAMLKEIHHRVKNNLQVISSLLSLQAAQVTTHPVAADVLAESQNRVRAMALVHETLYRSDDLARVDLSRYVGELCGYLFRSYGVDSARVNLVLDVESVTVSLEKTIPCGILMNEIVSNSLKYAFPGTRSGTVTIRARTEPDGLLTLTLADDGVGLPIDLVVDRTHTLGLQLVNILTDQLGGQLTLERFGGTRYTLSFAP